MLTLLGFGSSARRHATAWTDRARVRAVIEACQPDVVVDGASTAGGADDIVHGEAVVLGIRSLRCPVDHALDGAWPAAGHRRNARMYREHRPSLAAGFVSGRVGMPLSSGSAGMARICLRGLDGVPPCPVVVYREDGIEPYRDLSMALAMLRLLYVVTKDERLVPPGKALKMMAPRDEAIAALGFAAEGSRWAPWIEAVIATVKVNL